MPKKRLAHDTSVLPKSLTRSGSQTWHDSRPSGPGNDGRGVSAFSPRSASVPATRSLGSAFCA